MLRKECLACLFIVRLYAVFLTGIKLENWLRKSLVKDVTNKGKFYWIYILYSTTYIKKMLNTLLCWPLKNKVIWSREFQELIKKKKKKLCRSCYPMFAYHSTYNIFAVAVMFLRAKTTFYFNFEREELSLQASV